MIKELTNENYEEIVSADKPVVAEFYSPTCVHCKRTEAGIKELDEEGTEAVFATCDITREPALAERLDVQSLPTLLFIKNGEVINKLIGFTHKLIIAEEIKKLKLTLSENRLMRNSAILSKAASPKTSLRD